MIKSLELKNFQSHEDSEFELSEGVNTIIGSSDSGKSSVVRALQWIVFNKPSGESFRRKRSDNTEVSIVVGDAEFCREKSNNNINLYYKETKIDGCKEFKAFGQGVPEEVAKSLNLESINFQSQHDPPFLLSKSPGEVAKYLNEIVNLEKIDSSLSSINSKIKKVKQDILYKEETITELEISLIDYEWAEEAKEQLIYLEELDKGLQKTIYSEERLKQLILAVESGIEKVESYNDFLSIEPEVTKLLAINSEIEKIEDKRDSLSDHIGWILGEQTWLHEYNEILKNEKTVNVLMESSVNIQTLITNSNDLKNTMRRTIKTKRFIDEIELTLKKLEDNFIKLMPDECPLCGK